MPDRVTASLIIPRPPAPLPPEVAAFVAERPSRTKRPPLYRLKLRIARNHPAASYGAGVLYAGSQTIFDGHAFRALRDAVGAYIETNDPDYIRRCLGVPPNEPGIVQKIQSIREAAAE
jgi:hypothetical protein